MLVTWLPCGVPQYEEAAVTFPVQALPVSDIGGPGGKRAAAPLRHVRNSHASGGAHQAPPDGKMRPEYPDEVEEMGYEDSGKVYRGNLQPRGG